MFELLLIIYLLPVLIIGMLLLKLVFWLLKIAIRLAVWLVKKAFILIWKLIVLAFASDIYCFFLRITVCQSELYITSYGDVIRKLIGKC